MPESISTIDHALRLQTAALAIDNAAAEIDRDTPLLEQYEYVRVAIRESTRGVFAALGTHRLPLTARG